MALEEGHKGFLVYINRKRLLSSGPVQYSVAEGALSILMIALRVVPTARSFLLMAIDRAIHGHQKDSFQVIAHWRHRILCDLK